MNVEVFAVAAPAEFSAGFHFVEDEERAVLVGDVAQAFEEAGLGHAEADVHQNWFKNDRGNFAGIFFEAALDRSEIVEGGDLDIGDCGFRYAESAGNCRGVLDVAELGRVRLDADQSGIVQAVVGAFKFNNFVAAGGGASQADGGHGGFGSHCGEGDKSTGNT